MMLIVQLCRCRIEEFILCQIELDHQSGLICNLKFDFYFTAVTAMLQIYGVRSRYGCAKNITLLKYECELASMMFGLQHMMTMM